MSERSVIERLRERLLEGLAAPVKAKVEKGYIKSSPGGYCVDAQVVNPGSLEETGEILKEIPLSPLWLGADGRGIYAPPEEGQLIVVGFVGFNRAYPYVAGFAGDEYSPGGGKENALVLTDGKGGEFRMSGDGAFSLSNSSGARLCLSPEGVFKIKGQVGLKAILEDLYTWLLSITVLDPVSGLLPVNPAATPGIEAAKAKVALLLED